MLCLCLKGASILLMLNASLPGEQQFRKGIIQYLTQFKGSNTETNNLWDSLTQVWMCAHSFICCDSLCFFIVLTFMQFLQVDSKGRLEKLHGF